MLETVCDIKDAGCAMPGSMSSPGETFARLCGSEVLQGMKAIEYFCLLVARFGEEDATGEAFGFVRKDGRLKQRLLGFVDLKNLLDGKKVYGQAFAGFEYLLIDSGNSAGDSWKAFYFPRMKTLHVVSES